MADATKRMLVEAMLVRELHQEEDLAKAAEELGVKRLAVLVMSAFTVALSKRYAKLPTPTEVSAYSSYLGERYGHTERAVKPAVIESLIRGQLGELHLLDELELSDIIPSQMLVVYDVFTSLDPDEANVDAFVDDVLRLNTEYEANVD